MADTFPELKERLIKSLFRVKNLTSNIHAGENTKITEYGLSIAEQTLMSAVKYNAPQSNTNVGISDIQKLLYTSKAAISKMLGVLEKKGYINRDINKQNRRELIITLTEKGNTVLKDIGKDTDDMLLKIISQLGQEQTEQIINAINQFADVISDVMVNKN